jgi:DNA topoisomerase-1
MKAAQSLYESGYCSYIRTDSVRVADETIAEVRTWLQDNNYGLPAKPYSYKNAEAAQDAHECIHPTELTLLPQNNMAIIDPDEKLVYETIWNYFVASQMLPAKYNTLKITAHIKGDKSAEVRASGKAIKSNGFLEILGIDDKSSIDIPNLSKGDILHLSDSKSVKLDKKQTQPPPRYSEDKLIKELVIKNIGRPATYADLLSKICTRNYVENKNNVFHATDLGKKITDILTEYFTFMDYDYTAKLEKQLDDIEHKKVDHVDMLKKFYPSFKKELDKAYLGYGGNLCDKCGSPMSTRTNKKDNSTFLSCTNWPRCNNTKSISNPKK